MGALADRLALESDSGSWSQNGSAEKGLAETAQLDLFKHRTVLQTVETEHGPIKVVGSGFRLEHGGGSVERPPAKLGQHTDEVLKEAGYSPAEIESIRADKVA